VGECILLKSETGHWPIPLQKKKKEKKKWSRKKKKEEGESGRRD
jgi:hypothetical protein